MAQTTGYVLFDYAADEADELSIYKGEVVTILETYDDGWWLVGNNMDSGLVPSNYLTLEPQENHKIEHQSNELSSDAPTTSLAEARKAHKQHHHHEPSHPDSADEVSVNSARGVRQPEKVKTKKAPGGVAAGNSRVIDIPSSRQTPVNKSVETPTSNKTIPQVALDQNSLNFISKIINERLEKEFSTRDERIIDQMKSLLVDKDGSAARKSSHEHHHHSSSESPTKSRIPRILPKIKGDAPQSVPKPALVSSVSAPTSSSAENRLPLLVKNNNGIKINESVVKAAKEDQTAFKKLKSRGNSVPVAAMVSPRGEHGHHHQQLAIEVESDTESVVKQHHKPTPKAQPSRGAKAKHPTAVNISASETKVVVVDALTKGIQYPQCRSIVYPPSNIDDVELNTDAPSVSLALSHVYGCNSNATSHGLEIQVLGDGRVLFAAASVVVCMDPNNRKQSFFTQHTGEVTCFALHPDRQIVASAGLCDRDLVILLWDSKSVIAVTGKQSSKPHNPLIKRLTLPEGVRSVSCLSFSPDGLYLSAV
eukprot:gene31513-38921_t